MGQNNDCERTYYIGIRHIFSKNKSDVKTKVLPSYPTIAIVLVKNNFLIIP